MIKRLCQVFIITLFLFSSSASGQQSVNVVVLPFLIHAKEELSYLQSQIPTAIKRQLEQEGAKVLALDVDSVPAWKEQIESIAEIRKIGLQTGADFIIWGSMTWIGQQFSLDAKLTESGGEQKPSLFSVEGKGIENLPASVKSLTENISLVLFKREKIARISIDGNDRIEDDAIARVIKTKPGDVYNLKSISEDLKAIFAMGYFDDIRVEAEDTAAGKNIVFRVKEKPTLRSIKFTGNIKAFDDDEIREVITIRPGSILNIFHIKNDMNRIEELFKEKNYHNVNVDYKLFDRKNNQADIEFKIDEGKKVQITKIQFEGNQAFSDRKLRSVMTTSEKNLFSWFTNAGDLVQQNLDQDVAQITAFYHNHGYIQARAGEPKVEFKDDEIEITIKVVEGPQFKVGKVSLSGDLIVPEAVLMEKIKITDEEYYNREIIRNDILAIIDVYANEGYANVDAVPNIDQDEENLVVNIEIEIQKGEQIYFEKIIIGGNSKTRDKVIRRELRVYEQELFSASLLKRSIRNLYRLDYFEDVQVNTSKGSAANKKILKIDVKEKSTGAFQFGGGYGNVESFFGVANITERNLFGRGQRLSFEGKLGAKTTKFTLSFTEPWLFDIPLTAGIDAYNWSYSYDQYDKDSLGGNLRFGYPLFDYTRGYLTYTYDIADVSNIEEDAADSIKKLQGTNLKSSIKASVVYDSRDSRFHPTKGSNNIISSEFAGLGGDIGFIKPIVETAWYYNIFWKVIGVAHAKAGFVQETPDKILPDYDKFYMGGIDSLRGFERDDVAPRDDNGSAVGGDEALQFNLEVRVPLVEQAGVYGVVFFDAGNVYGVNKPFDPTDLRMSVGPGIRWLSPMGPINLYYGFILDPEPTDHGPGGWEFSMATAF
jgi:outer membrane protein insertion porin family